MLSVFRRRDFLSPFLAPRRAHRHRSVSGCIIEIPLPSNRFRIVCWHTLAFRLGWRTYERLLRSILREEDFVCYVVHPADLICQEDMDPSRRTRAERMSVPFPVKLRLFENSLACLMEDGRQCLTMQEMANAISKRLPGPSSAPAR
jgi:hypothetical protein